MMFEKNYLYLFLAILTVYLLGFQVNIMEIDAAQYANISRVMWQTKHFLQVEDIGLPYLDKPPFLFWCSSVSIACFGETNVGYKFPSFLFAILAIYSTYRYAKIFYNQWIAIVAALVLASSQALFLITNDVRTDTILMATCIFSFWQFATAFQTNKKVAFALGFIGLAIGILTKGPIVMVVVGLAFLTDILLRKDWKQLFRWEYTWGLLLIAVIISPFCYGLYQQFDAKGGAMTAGYGFVESGVRFFLWTQSFGRVTGESPWNNGATITFLYENMLWSFLPWIFIVTFGTIYHFYNSFFSKKNLEIAFFKENITVSGVLWAYVCLGSSKYQLPHYAFLFFPLLSVVTAVFLEKYHTELFPKRFVKYLVAFQYLILSILCLAATLIVCYVFPVGFSILFLLLAILFLALVYYIWKNFWKKTHYVERMIVGSILTMLLVNTVLSCIFYPKLLTYQATSEAAIFLKKKEIKTNVYCYETKTLSSFYYYSGLPIAVKTNKETFEKGDYFFLNQAQYSFFLSEKINIELVETFDDFAVTKLSFTFLNPVTRAKVLDKKYLVKIMSK